MVVELVSSQAAAAVLELSPVRVRELIDAGELQATKVGGRWFVDRADLDALARRQRPAGRPLAPGTAWALLALLGAPQVPDLPAPQLSRLRRRLRARPDVAEVAAATRRRRHVERLRAHPGVLGDLRADPRVVLSGASAAGHDVIDVASVEGYVAAEDLAAVCADHHLRSAPTTAANVSLSVPAVPWWPFGPDRRAWPAVVAVDLADAGDVRSVRAARRLWTRALDAWPGMSAGG